MKDLQLVVVHEAEDPKKHLEATEVVSISYVWERSQYQVVSVLQENAAAGAQVLYTIVRLLAHNASGYITN